MAFNCPSLFLFDIEQVLKSLLLGLGLVEKQGILIFSTVCLVELSLFPVTRFGF